MSATNAWRVTVGPDGGADIPFRRPRAGKNACPTKELRNHSAFPLGRGRLVSVIIPVYNEARTLEEVVRRVLAVPMRKEVVIVDDASTDGSDRIAGRIAKREADVRFLRHPVNRGKGAAVRTGLAAARGDAFIVQDADLEYDPEDLPGLFEPVFEGRAQVVYGSRVKGRNRYSHLRYYLGGRLLSLVTNVLYGVHISDEPTCYKVFTREVLQKLELRAEGFEFCPELTAKVILAGYHILEVPISYTPRTIKQGKKIRWTDGAVAIWTLLRLRLAGRRG